MPALFRPLIVAVLGLSLLTCGTGCPHLFGGGGASEQVVETPPIVEADGYEKAFGTANALINWAYDHKYLSADGLQAALPSLTEGQKWLDELSVEVERSPLVATDGYRRAKANFLPHLANVLATRDNAKRTIKTFEAVGKRVAAPGESTPPAVIDTAPQTPRPTEQP